MFRFVHAADLHLDSPFQGLLTSTPPNVAERLRESTLDAFDEIVGLCLARQVDALLVAGDVFDSADRSLRAQLRFVGGLRRLDEAGIRSFVCHGNHDPLDGWEARLAFPPGCHRFGPEVERVPVFSDDPDRAAVYGISYPRREVRENLAPRFRKSGAERLSIGLLHANVGENTGHEPYAPCSLGELASAGFDYWALGHVHSRGVLREDSPAIAYPGNPQGRHPNEAGERGVFLVEVSDDRRVSLSFVPVDAVRWETLALGIEDIEDDQELLDLLGEELQELREKAEGRDLVIRVSLTGRGPLHASLSRPGVAEDIRTQLNEAWAERGPFVFCERLVDETAPVIDRRERSRGEDFVAELLRLIDVYHDSPERLDELAAELDPLYGNARLARYLRNATPSRAGIAELLAEAERICLDKLVEGESP